VFAVREECRRRVSDDNNKRTSVCLPMCFIIALMVKDKTKAKKKFPTRFLFGIVPRRWTTTPVGVFFLFRWHSSAGNIHQRNYIIFPVAVVCFSNLMYYLFYYYCYKFLGRRPLNDDLRDTDAVATASAYILSFDAAMSRTSYVPAITIIIIIIISQSLLPSLARRLSAVMPRYRN